MRSELECGKLSLLSDQRDDIKRRPSSHSSNDITTRHKVRSDFYLLYSPQPSHPKPVTDMPAAVPSPANARIAAQASTTPHSPVRKRRIVRRRGRKGSVESDDEIERELGTDSESEDELSSLDSASDSDTEPASEDVVPNGHSRAFTPNTSQSSDRGVMDKDLSQNTESFFAPAGNWSEMVAEETTNGPAELPVIEFADFDGQDSAPPTARPRKAKKPARSVSEPVPHPQPTDGELGDKSDEREQRPSASRHSSKSPFPVRSSGQSARQAYQQRLESDPSYVPTVGGFWGHDDRLLDKDLRSLSGWWRGRWQGRGRGRGSMRGRGRGGYFGSSGSQPNQEMDGPIEDPLQSGGDVPPIERQWTHDGFEEMKHKEDGRSGQETQQHAPAAQAAGGFRGGRGFTRGGRGGFSRGFAQASARASSGNPGRIWYQMKPELMWTKQHEGFLHFDLDPALKPRQGQGVGIQVKLPGKAAKIVRAPLRSWKTVVKIPILKPATPVGSDAGEKAYAVRLPTAQGKVKQVNVQAATASPSEEAPKARPLVGRRHSLPVPREELSAPQDASAAGHSHVLSDSTNASLVTSLMSRLEISVESPPQPALFMADTTAGTKTEEAVLQHPSPEIAEVARSQGETQIPAPLPSIQTVFTPPISQPSPVYGSPYGYVPALPPGIAMNQHGVPYELSTGRPVYLQAAPPPMYNPRPIMHSHVSSSSIPFIPSHVPHQSAVSPDFLAQSASHTPPVNGFIDPSTGTPIFSFPRQTTRIKISAPLESGAAVKSPGNPSPSHQSNPSGLRTTATSFEPSGSVSESARNGYHPRLRSPEMNNPPIYAPLDGPGEGSTANHHPQDPMIAYQYPQHYYYPEPYFSPYVDMTQVGQYEMYPSDGYTPQGAVYY